MITLIPHTVMGYLNGCLPEDQVKHILLEAGFSEDHQFRFDKIMPDEEWQKFIGIVLENVPFDRAEFMEQYSVYFCEFAAKEFSVWFDKSQNSYEFICKQPKIHNGFYTGQGGYDSTSDKFQIEARENEVVTYYNSSNQLCDFYKALAMQVVKYYQDDAEVSEPKCVHKGDPFCEIHIKWKNVSG